MKHWRNRHLNCSSISSNQLVTMSLLMPINQQLNPLLPWISGELKSYSKHFAFCFAWPEWSQRTMVTWMMATRGEANGIPYVATLESDENMRPMKLCEKDVVELHEKLCNQSVTAVGWYVVMWSLCMKKDATLPLANSTHQSIRHGYVFLRSYCRWSPDWNPFVK